MLLEESNTNWLRNLRDDSTIQLQISSASVLAASSSSSSTITIPELRSHNIYQNMKNLTWMSGAREENCLFR